MELHRTSDGRISHLWKNCGRLSRYQFAQPHRNILAGGFLPQVCGFEDYGAGRNPFGTARAYRTNSPARVRHVELHGSAGSRTRSESSACDVPHSPCQSLEIVNLVKSKSFGSGATPTWMSYNSNLLCKVLPDESAAYLMSLFSSTS
jgi:hypothetical protein